LLGATRPASAEHALHRDSWTLQAHLDSALHRLAALPSVGPPPDTELQGRVVRGAAASTGPSTLLGVGAGLDLVLRDRTLLPLFAVDVAWSVGRRPTVYGSIDGSVVEQHPWDAWQLTTYFGGAGVRWKRRRWALAAALLPGVAFTFLETRVPGPGDPERTFTGIDLALRGHVEGCRRVDPEQRVCLLLGAHFFLERPLNGGVLGLRWELGP
jgi:hypothetical protein